MPKHPHDLVIPVAFAGAGLLSGWMGEGGWIGVTWAFFTLISGVAIGDYFARKKL